MRKFLFSFIFCVTVNYSYGQLSKRTGYDVTVNGYLFLSSEGLFFQPLDFEQDKDFIPSLDKRSFKIQESNLIIFSDVLKGVGTKLLVKNYFEDTIRKNSKLKIYDTITYFKCNIYIGMNFFDTSYNLFNEIGYGFILNNNLIYYGNLAIKNQLYKIIPDDIKVIEQFYNSYQNKKIYPPEWLKTIYAERKVKKNKNKTSPLAHSMIKNKQNSTIF